MHQSEKASRNPLTRQRTKSKEERRVKFPHEIVFDEMVKEGDSSEIMNFMRRESVDVDINKRNEHGNTALNEMIKNGNLKCVKVLIGLGADVNRKDEKGTSILYFIVIESCCLMLHFVVLSKILSL